MLSYLIRRQQIVLAASAAQPGDDPLAAESYILITYCHAECRLGWQLIICALFEY
jgi:hypothetical protein